MSSNSHYTNQITIVHLSDLHFGSKHICMTDDPSASNDGIPELSNLIQQDLSTDFGASFSNQLNHSLKNEPPIILAITGDFTQKAEHSEFEQATKFLNKLCDNQLLNQNITKNDIFMIPGNHDVVFTKETSDERFQPYASFYNKFFEGIRPTILPHDALGITQIHEVRKDNNKLLVAEINCCMYVKNDTIDKSRGQVSMKAISKIRQELEEFKNKSGFDEYIKIALIHHHVVLLPSFIETGRGVDSIVHARHLLELLSEFNFHLILHGHKHYPHIFSYDPLPLWNENQNKIPQIVISGGSCGSTELPADSINSCNTYCVINFKWHPAAKQARIKVTTRGLVRKGLQGSLTPDRWSWQTVNVSEKVIAPNLSIPNPNKAKQQVFLNDDRANEYSKLRGNMPIIEVMPSLIPDQAYEARVWIVQHSNPPSEDKELIRVDWTAGANFKTQTAEKDLNPKFCVSFHYWGPMLIQADLTFKDGHVASTFIYARIPKHED